MAHGTAGAGLEFWGESLRLHSLLRGGGLDDGGVLLRSSSKFGETFSRPFEVLILFAFECCKISENDQSKTDRLFTHWAKTL